MNPLPSSATVFDGALLRAQLFLPPLPGSVLYVTFQQSLAKPGDFSIDGPVQQALA